MSRLYFNNITRDLTNVVLSKIRVNNTLTDLLNIKLNTKLYKLLFKIRHLDLYNDIQKILPNSYYKDMKDHIYPIIYTDSFKFEGKYFTPAFQNELEDFSDLTVYLTRCVAVYREYPYLFNNLDTVFKAIPILMFQAFSNHYPGGESLLKYGDFYYNTLNNIFEYFRTGIIKETLSYDDQASSGGLMRILLIYLLIKLKPIGISFGPKTKEYIDDLLNRRLNNFFTPNGYEDMLSKIYSDFFAHMYNYIISNKDTIIVTL